MFDKVFAAIQYPLPHHFLSGLVYRLMRIRFKPVKNLLITVVGGIAGVDWSEAARQDLADTSTSTTFSPANSARASAQSTRTRSAS